jgi:hypothetical protein
MPNILKRPMFRKGGSTAYGTGITANLEPRKIMKRVQVMKILLIDNMKVCYLVMNNY